MECYYCKGELKDGVVPYFVKRKGYQFVIDRVPAYVCSQCGEYLFREKEVDLIQEIISALEQKIALMIIPNPSLQRKNSLRNNISSKLKTDKLRLKAT